MPTPTATTNMATVKAAQKEVDDFVKAGADLLDAYNALKTAEKKGTQVKEMFLVNTNETTTMAYTDSLKVISASQQTYDIALAALSKEQREAMDATGKLEDIFGDLNYQINTHKEVCDAASKAYDTALNEAKLADLDISKSSADKKSMWSTVAIQAKNVTVQDGELARIKASALSTTITQAVLDAGIAVYKSDPSNKVNDTAALISEIERCDAEYDAALKAKIEADAAYADATKTLYRPVADDNSAEIARLNAVIAQNKKDADAAVAKANADAAIAIADNKKKADAAVAAAVANNVPAPAPPAPTFVDLVLKTILDLIKPKA